MDERGRPESNKPGVRGQGLCMRCRAGKLGVAKAQGAGGMQSWMLVLALLPAVPPATESVEQGLPGFVYIEHRKYYDLDARTLYALRTQLEERRREMGTGAEPVGRTTQRLEVRYELLPLPAGCQLRAVELTLEVTIHLPRWRPEGRRPVGLGKRWDTMLEALTRHEEGHRDNALWAAHGLHRRLLELAEPGQDCLALHRAAQRERFKAEVRYRQRDQAYDRRTDHGVRQGSVL